MTRYVTISALCIILLCILDQAHARKTVLFLNPSAYEQEVCSRPEIQSRYQLIYYHWHTDVPLSYAHLQRGGRDIVSQYGHVIDGILCTQEYTSNILASLVAERCNVPGPSVAAVLRCQHKYYTRCVQRKAVPEATPEFCLIDPDDYEASVARMPFSFPCFVKPVKAYFSFGATRVESADDLYKRLYDILPARAFLCPINETLSAYGFMHDADYMLAEETLSGKQVTLEGYVHNGVSHVIGIVDASMYPGTISFQQFSYPSTVPREAQDRMCDIARRCVYALGIEHGGYNIEYMYHPDTKEIYIIEINPRFTMQFADLYEKVDGVNGYKIMLAVAAGDTPPVYTPGSGVYQVGASFADRVFQDAYVSQAPTARHVARAQRRFPDARIMIHAQKDMYLSDQLQDGNSYLYNVINLGGHSWRHLHRRYTRCMRLLPFRFDYRLDKGR